jgi:hypothetical protein
MIKELKMFTVICDRCGKSADDGTEYAGWGSEEGAWTVADEDNWIKHEGGDYCPDCYKYDDDDDNLIIKPNVEK